MKIYIGTSLLLLLLVEQISGNVFYDLFGTTGTICTDASYLGVTCSCPVDTARLYQGTDCSRRNITSLPPGLVVPDGVTFISFFENKLKVIVTDQFAENYQVTKVKLSKNEIAVLEEKAFSGLRMLEALWLEKNMLTEISASAFHGLSKLRELNLGTNRLTSIDPMVFAGTHQLTELRLEYNPLVTLNPEMFLYVPRLQLLDLDSTDISELPDGIFSSNLQLERLLLPHNQLSSVPTSALSEANSVRFLDLSGNSIEKIPASSFQGMVGLRKLVINTMRNLKKIEANAFSGLEKLEELQCQFNGALTEVDPAAFRSLDTGEYISSLTRVDVNEGGLMFISREVLPWDRMEYVNLAMNPWNCDCEMAWVAHDDFLFEAEPLFKCKSPEAVKGRQVTTLTEEEFVCENGGANIVLIVFLVLLGVAVVAGIVFAVWKFQICQKAKAKLFTRPKYNNVKTSKDKVEVDGLEWDNKDIGV